MVPIGGVSASRRLSLTAACNGCWYASSYAWVRYARYAHAWLSLPRSWCWSLSSQHGLPGPSETRQWSRQHDKWHQRVRGVARGLTKRQRHRFSVDYIKGVQG